MPWMAAAIIGSSLIGAAASSSASGQAADAAASANAQNAQLERENRAANEALTRQQLEQNTGLITDARDRTTGLLTDQRDANQTATDAYGREVGLNRDLGNSYIQSGLVTSLDAADLNRQRNQAELTTTVQGLQRANEATQTSNQAEINRNLAANEATFATTRDQNSADITGYSDRAAGAISGVMDESRGLFNPFVQTGTAAGDAIAKLLGIAGDASAQQGAFKNFRDSTGYDFAVREAERGVMGNSAALGLTESGSAAKALSDRRQGIADSSFGSYFDRLAGQQGVGLNAAGQLSSALGQGAGQLSSLYQNTGTSLAGNRNQYATNSSTNRNNATAATLDNSNDFLGRTTTNAGNYYNGTTANNNSFAGAQTDATNFATTNNLTNQANYLTGQRGVLDNTTTNNNGYYGGQANNVTNAALNLANVNSAATGALVGGNNAATNQLTAGNSDTAGAQGNAFLAGASGVNSALNTGVNAFAQYMGTRAGVPATNPYTGQPAIPGWGGATGYSAR